MTEILKVRKNVLECLKMIGYNTHEYENISSAEILALPSTSMSTLTMDIYKQEDEVEMTPSPSPSLDTPDTSTVMVPETERNQELLLTSENVIALPSPAPRRQMVRVVYIEEKITKEELVKQIETHFQTSTLVGVDEMNTSTTSPTMDVHHDRKLSSRDTLMIISMSSRPISDVIREYLRRYWEMKQIFITVQCYKYFMFCILKHQYVPWHKILTEEEKRNILQRYRVRHEEEMSEISRFDPVAIAILLRPGQMVEIHRPSNTAGTTFHYRICVQK